VKLFFCDRSARPLARKIPDKQTRRMQRIKF
jgi:hypothetical protein